MALDTIGFIKYVVFHFTSAALLLLLLLLLLPRLIFPLRPLPLPTLILLQLQRQLLPLQGKLKSRSFLLLS